MSISPVIAVAASAVAQTAGAAAAATQPAGPERVTAAALLVPGITAAVTVAVAAWLGVFRPGSVDGPLRVPRQQAVWPLFVVLVAGTVVWFGLQTVVVDYRQFKLVQERGPTATVNESMFTPVDWAVLATVPGVLALVVLVGGALVWSRQSAGLLGYGLGQFPRGVLQGVVATLVTLPWMWLVMTGAQWVYQAIDYKHPQEHDLLRIMTQAPEAWVRWTLIAGAVLVAPVFEEFLFRGFLQTWLRHALIRLTDPFERPEAAYGPPPAAFPVVGYAGAAGPYGAATGFAPAGYPTGMVPPPPPHDGPAVPGALPYAGADVAVPPTLEDSFRRPGASHVAATWSAIFGTSILFTLVHVQPWMFPPIFFLSLCLGYAYERTGKLWVPITLHALFNTTSTVIYLMTRS